MLTVDHTSALDYNFLKMTKKLSTNEILHIIDGDENIDNVPPNLSQEQEYHETPNGDDVLHNEK